MKVSEAQAMLDQARQLIDALTIGIEKASVSGEDEVDLLDELDDRAAESINELQNAIDLISK